MTASERYNISDVWNILTTEHDFHYSAEKLLHIVWLLTVDGYIIMKKKSDNLLKLSYGRVSSSSVSTVSHSMMKTVEYRDGHIVFSLNVYFFVIASLVAIIGVYVCVRNQNNDQQKRINPFR